MKKFIVAATLVILPFTCIDRPAHAADAKGTIDPISGKSCSHCHRSKITGKFVHEAVAGKECTPCHQTLKGNHQRDHSLFGVKDKSAKLCYECHDNQSTQKSVHPPIQMDECLGCHAPHNAPRPKLLRENLGDLCWECHDKALLTEKETTKTGFRDGVQNLHFAHANQNAIACLACHDAHASTQLHLIRPKGSNGKEAVTNTYTATPKGGNCTVSCHDALGYERK